MIVVDTSAIIAILAAEASAEPVQRRLSTTRRCVMSAASWVEAAIVAGSRLGPDGAGRLEELMGIAGIARESFDVAQAELAVEAYRRYGRGSGSPAKLNFGDCFSYALAKSLDAPLLYVGDDFASTDIRSALAS